MANKSVNPWFWVPTLYFAEGVPYFLVNQISVAIFTTLGVANDSMAFFTSLIYLPWVIKPFWAPFVDIIRTKRWWIIAMEAIMALTMVLTVLSIPHPSAEMMAAMATPVKLFYITLVWFIIMAFASATHDIAADGFYMLALVPGQQAEMIGWRSVFYRLSN
ncbi:MAG: MFS transporter, partial [Paludibacteraceae bacterium]|nr:MFS transporter [Paludibacteraceae bacterium]